jgi:5-methylcytosine-specific restriction endonuclease McrA
VKRSRAVTRRRRKGELTRLAESLDKALRKAALKRDGDKCCHCGKPKSGKEALHTSHVIPKREGHGLRWSLTNVVMLCYRCHMEWWHKNTLEAARWFRETYPERYRYVWDNRHMERDYDITSRKRLLAFLERKAR